MNDELASGTGRIARAADDIRVGVRRLTAAPPTTARPAARPWLDELSLSAERLQTELASLASFVTTLLPGFTEADVGEGQNLLAARFRRCEEGIRDFAAALQEPSLEASDDLAPLADTADELMTALQTAERRLDTALASGHVSADVLRGAARAWDGLHDRVTALRLET
jgi:hypothetical protein